MQPLSGNQRPDFLTSLMNMYLVCACHGRCIVADPRQMSHTCHRFWKCYKTLTFRSLLTRCTVPWACHAKPHLNVQKASKSAPYPTVFCTFDFEVCFAPQPRAIFEQFNFQKCSDTFSFHILTSKCASRHNGVHFFDISTSKSARTHFFSHFDFEMCFAPQRRALFRHLNFQKWSEHGVLCTF